MKNRDVLYTAAAALGGLAGAVIASRVAAAYHRDQRVTTAQLLARSTVIETAHGPVEYAERGRGPAVLILHGAGGGYDQSLACAELLGEAGLRFILPSRFGYLRSPLPPNATPEAQADTCAALLDALGIKQAAALALSAGGMTGVAFALRHPARCTGLGLISAITQPLVVMEPAMQAVSTLALRSDFASWVMRQGGLKLISQTTGLSADEAARLAGEPDARRSLLNAINLDPVSRRRAGILNDTVQAEVLPEWPLADIAAPTLVIHGTADPLVPLAMGERTAYAIPRAQILKLEGAGHLAWFTHAAQTRPATLEFLTAHAPQG